MTTTQTEHAAYLQGWRAGLADEAEGVYDPLGNPYLGPRCRERSHRGCRHGLAQAWADGYVATTLPA